MMAAMKPLNVSNTFSNTLPARMSSDPSYPPINPTPCFFIKKLQILQATLSDPKNQRRILLFLLFLPIILSSTFGE